MKTITLKEAHKILSDASAVVIDDNSPSISPVTYPALSPLNGKDENEFLFLSWSDSDRQSFCLTSTTMMKDMNMKAKSQF
jgi:hypothetical protein